MKLLVLVALVCGCRYGTIAPGVERCTTGWFIVGYYRECERGPTWEEIARHDPKLFSELLRRLRPPEEPPEPADAKPAPAVPIPVVAHPKKPRAVAGDWWCTVRDDGMGLCLRGKASCESFRAPNGPGGNSGYSICGPQASAVCAGDNCFTSVDACDAFEKRSGRSAAACVIE